MALTKTGVELRPITDADVRRAAEFLHANLNTRVSADDWEASVDVPWDVDRPNAGFMLLDGDTVVGAHLAFYSDAGRRRQP